METENSSFVTVPHSHDNHIKLNVGGKLFETTIRTLQSSGPDSLLTALSKRKSQSLDDPIFIDRDPDIFSVILSLLRSNHLPSNANFFSKQELAEEAAYYGIETHLKSKMSPPPLHGYDASLVNTVCPAAEAVPSAFTAAADDGSIWIAHGGQISSYDWTLSHTGTFRTHLNDINCIDQVWPEVAALGSELAAGIHLYNLSDGCHVGTVHWNDPTDPRTHKAAVAAITDSPTQVFASFDSQHRENCVLIIDKSTLQTVSELGRQKGSSSKTIVPSKLTWMSETGVLISSSVTSGAFGYSGYIRLWDPRSGNVVWETSEPGSGRSARFGDSFADVCVDLEGSRLFKICSKSGDLAMADLRNLGEDPWVYLRDKSHSMRSAGSLNSYVIHSYKKQVFVGRGGGLEVWSPMEGWENGMESCEGMYRRNYVDKVEDSLRGIIRNMDGGGDRLFISRDDVEGVEVWESSILSGIISTL